MEQGQTQKTLDHYTLIKKLGEGNFGKVYLAFNKNSGVECAVKIITNTQNLKCVDDLKREFDMMGRINHPNVLQAYGISFEGIYKNKAGEQSLNKVYLCTELSKNGE